MRKIICFLVLILLTASVNTFAQTTGGEDDYYNAKVYTSQGGDSMIVKLNGKIILRTGGQVLGGTKLVFSADSIIAKTGSYVIIQSGATFNAADKIASTDTIEISSGGTLYIASGGRGQFADKVTTTDTIDIASGGTLIISSGGRIQANDKITTADTIQVATNAVIYVATGGRIISDGLVDADTINAESANIDSLRTPHINVDTTRINKVLATVSGNVIAGTATFSGADSVTTYVKGLTTSDIILVTPKATGGAKADSSVQFWAVPRADSLVIISTKNTTRDVYWFRLLVQ